MAFGNLVTDGTQVAVGTVGYIVAFNLSAQEVARVTQVQLEKVSTTTFSDPVTAAVSAEALFGYLDDSAAPSVAFVQAGMVVSVFVKTASYAFSSDTRIAFWYRRNAADVAAVGDAVDVPQEAKELLKAVVLRSVLVNASKRQPLEIGTRIAAERARLGI